MLNEHFDYVEVTFTDDRKLEGYLVDENVLVSHNSNTQLSDSTVKVIRVIGKAKRKAMFKVQLIVGAMVYKTIECETREQADKVVEANRGAWVPGPDNLLYKVTQRNILDEHGETVECHTSTCETPKPAFREDKPVKYVKMFDSRDDSPV